MAWIDDALERLVKSPVCGYQLSDAGATEPSALTALALAGHGVKGPTDTRFAAEGNVVGRFLQEIQGPDGSVGVRKGEESPRWPTSLALLAWLAVNKLAYSDQIARGVRWALSIEGERLKQSSTGHNSMLSAWPWVEGTHSWIEPSAFFALAFKALSLSDHQRTREAVTLLIDRILPDGGCNYGNTAVLGQLLRPHVQPTGIALLALRSEFDVNHKLARSLDYLSKEVTPDTTSASLAWALLGLAAHDRTPRDADQLLAAAFARTIKRDQSPHKIALLALAALGAQAPLITLQQA
jgi:hypothetical protein